MHPSQFRGKRSSKIWTTLLLHGLEPGGSFWFALPHCWRQRCFHPSAPALKIRAQESRRIQRQTETKGSIKAESGLASGWIKSVFLVAQKKLPSGTKTVPQIKQPRGLFIRAWRLDSLVFLPRWEKQCQTLSRLPGLWQPTMTWWRAQVSNLPETKFSVRSQGDWMAPPDVAVVFEMTSPWLSRSSLPCNSLRSSAPLQNVVLTVGYPNSRSSSYHWHHCPDHIWMCLKMWSLPQKWHVLGKLHTIGNYFIVQWKPSLRLVIPHVFTTIKWKNGSRML